LFKHPPLPPRHAAGPVPVYQVPVHTAVIAAAAALALATVLVLLGPGGPRAARRSRRPPEHGTCPGRPGNLRAGRRFHPPMDVLRPQARGKRRSVMQIKMLNRLVLMASVGTVLAVLPAAASQASASGRYTKINVPGAAATFPADINNPGVIDGFYFDASGKDHGYIDRSGRFTTLDYPRPGVSLTEADGINDFGVCVGLYADAHGVAHGFLYRHGRFTAINDPKASPTPAGGTAAFSINDSGAIVGEYGDAHGVSHGFVYRHGRFTTIDDPHASTAPGAGTFAIGINNLGVIDGVYVDSRGLFHSFIDRGGKFTTIDDPHASTAPGAGTFAATINDLGAVTGFYVGAHGASQGFVYRHGVFTTIDDPAAAAGTTKASGINDRGVIVGGYQDKITGNEDGFELRPAR
jgi:hypothetical protein